MMSAMNDLPIEAQLVPMTDAMKHHFHLDVCACPACKGALDFNKMCVLHLLEDYFLEIGKCPVLVAKRIFG